MADLAKLKHMVGEYTRIKTEISMLNEQAKDIVEAFAEETGKKTKIARSILATHHANSLTQKEAEMGEVAEILDMIYNN